MDDADTIAKTAFDNTLEEYLQDYIHSGAFCSRIQSIIVAVVGGAISSLQEHQDRMDTELVTLRHKIEAEGYEIDKQYGQNGELEDVILIRKTSDY